MISPFSINKKRDSSIKIVLLDDNFVIRHLVKSTLSRIKRKSDQSIEFFSSENGVQGLGYVFISRPNVIIVDLTLPKYSGREVVEFIATNQQFTSQTNKIIVLSDGSIPDNLPSWFRIIDKNNFNFMSEITNEIVNTVEPSANSNRFVKGSLIAWLANKNDRAIQYMDNWNGIRKAIGLFPWVLVQIMINIGITFGGFSVRELVDLNKDQKEIDSSLYLNRFYPTFITVFVLTIIIIIQLLLFFFGSTVLFELGESINKLIN